MTSFQLQPGTSPLLVSMPHVGTEIADALRPAYTPRTLELEDTDWHLDRLYDFLPDLGASVLQARQSRYVIDLNRPPDDMPMYPGASNTELCPTRFFTGDALYRPGQEPLVDERVRRRTEYWEPYHAALARELSRIVAQHGFVLLWDAHSIRSEIAWLFAGRLPDLNIGTAGGTSCDPAITDSVARACAGAAALSSVVNGRFTGGYLTRHYGNPRGHGHALQREMCQCTYMQEAAPFAFDAARARRVQPVLRAMLQAALAAAASCHG